MPNNIFEDSRLILANLKLGRRMSAGRKIMLSTDGEVFVGPLPCDHQAPYMKRSIALPGLGVRMVTGGSMVPSQFAEKKTRKGRRSTLR